MIQHDYRFEIPYTNHSAYSLGWETCRAGDDITENPYAVGTFDWQLFRYGYTAFTDTRLRKFYAEQERLEKRGRGKRR